LLESELAAVRTRKAWSSILALPPGCVRACGFSGGRSPVPPRTTTGYLLPTLRVGPAAEVQSPLREGGRWEAGGFGEASAVFDGRIAEPALDAAEVRRVKAGLFRGGANGRRKASRFRIGTHSRRFATCGAAPKLAEPPGCAQLAPKALGACWRFRLGRPYESGSKLRAVQTLRGMGGSQLVLAGARTHAPLPRGEGGGQKEVRPHPGPLPRGEGVSFRASDKACRPLARTRCGSARELAKGMECGGKRSATPLWLGQLA